MALKNPRNPPRPPRDGCPTHVGGSVHSCAHCSSTWRCTACGWPLALDEENGQRVCLHCEGVVLTEREWSVLARTGLPPHDYRQRALTGPGPKDGALDDATLDVTTRLVAARAAHTRAASDLDLAKAGRKEAAQARGVQTGATALATWGATVEAGVSSPFVVDRRADTPPGGPWHRVGFAYWVRRADGAEVTSADAMASLRQWCAVAATERPAEAP